MKPRRYIIPDVKNITAEMMEGMMIVTIETGDNPCVLCLWPGGGEERDRLWEICDGIQRAGAGSYEEKGEIKS